MHKTALTFAHASPCIDGSADLLRHLVDSSQTLTWSMDANDMCIYLHPCDGPFSRQFNSLDISAWVCLIHPDDLDVIAAKFRCAKRRRIGFHIEYRIIMRDATVRWLMTTGVPQLSDNGEFRGYAGMTVDVTQQHKELALAAKWQKRSRLLAQYATECVFHCARDGTILDMTASVMPLLGFDGSELVGEKVYRLMHTDDALELQEEVAHHVQNGVGRDVECRLFSKKGVQRRLGVKVHALVDPVAREHLGTVLVMRDITVERHLNDELKLREERHRNLMRLASGWYWETDAVGRFTHLSADVESYLGVRPKQLIGMSQLELAADQGHPGLQEYLAKFDNHEVFTDIRFPLNCGASGTPRFITTSGEPVFENGVFKGYRGFSRDMTKKMALKQEAARLAAENKALLENSLDLIALLDADMRFVRVNHAVTELLGYLPSELLDRQYEEFVVEEDKDNARLVISSLRHNDGPVRNFEVNFYHKDGGVVALSWSIRWSNDVNAMYATARDVTRSHLMQTALRHANERLCGVLETIGDAFFSVDRHWRITYANRKIAELVGHPQQALVGKVIWEAIPEILDPVIFSHYEHAMETGKPLHYHAYYKPTQAWVQAHGFPYEDGLSVFFEDVTEKRNAQHAAKKSEQRLREVIEMTPAGYILADAQSRVLDVNPALCNMTGYAREELLGQDTLQIFTACPCREELSIQCGATEFHGKECAIRHKDGHLVFVLLNAHIDRDDRGNAEFLTAFITNITERIETEAQLEQLAKHDVLTGLPNRALLNERLQALLDHAPRRSSYAVMFIDLDRFKEVNDSMGHKAGDALLCEVATRLKQEMRPGDMVARLGGDEFVIVAHCDQGTASAEKIAERMLTALAAPIDIEGQEVYIGGSIGISMFPQDGTTKELLFQNVDTAMYRAKAAGRNDYRFFTEAMSSETKIRMTLENALRRALERDEFEIHYQPRINLRTVQVTGMEALLRWKHPVHGNVAPTRFIPVAEEVGLITPIGMWVLENACRHAKRLMEKFTRPLHLSVNLSIRQLRSVNLPAQVAAILHETSFPAHLLELELTETALVEDIDSCANVLRDLKQLGIQLSVDDFGTGHSGLAYLRHFPMDILKLDQSFLRQKTESVDQFGFIKAVIDLAHALNLKVVAEGVETVQIMQFLQRAACDEAQGFLFAKPMALTELEAYLTEAAKGGASFQPLVPRLSA